MADSLSKATAEVQQTISPTIGKRGASTSQGRSGGTATIDSNITAIDREVASLNSGFSRILKLFGEERAKLVKERDLLAEERKSFEAMQQRIDGVNNQLEETIKLNIGGEHFETTRSTLTAEEGSMLEAMFSGRFNVEKDENGICFIDRDPQFFSIILSYLRGKRDGCVPCKVSMEAFAAASLLREANFYGLRDLERLVDTSIVVSQDGDGHYTKIQDALRAAKPGDKIIVRPGIYFEYIFIDRNIEIVGDPQTGKDVLLTYSGEHVVTSSADSPVLKNIIINQQGEEYHSLFVTAGCLRVEGCSFISSGWACVGISGETTHPHLLKNKVLSSSDNGIIILSHGKGLIEYNDIEGFTLQGIEIREGSNPVVRHNKIHHGDDSGIYVNTKGRGVIESNEIYCNAFNGIAVKFDGQPRKISHNVIYGNKQEGIFVSSDSLGSGIDETNKLHGNKAGDDGE